MDLDSIPWGEIIPQIIAASPPKPVADPFEERALWDEVVAVQLQNTDVTADDAANTANQVIMLRRAFFKIPEIEDAPPDAQTDPAATSPGGAA